MDAEDDHASETRGAGSVKFFSEYVCFYFLKNWDSLICLHEATCEDQEKAESALFGDLQLQDAGNGQDQNVEIRHYVDDGVHDHHWLRIIYAELGRDLGKTVTFDD